MAKRLNSVYQPGRRSPDWRKIKNVFRQEFETRTLLCPLKAARGGAGLEPMLVAAG